MIKQLKKSLKIIIAMVLILVMLGGNFVWADTPNMDKTTVLSERDMELKQEDDSENGSDGTRTTVKTEYIVHYGYCDTTESYNVPGSTYGSMPVPFQPGFIFIGWFEDLSIEGIEYTGDTVVPNHDVKLHAHWGQFYRIENVGAGKKLNIYGSNITYLYNGMNVTLWTASGSNEQKWVFNCDEIYQIYFRSYVDLDYGLNVYRAGSPWNCNVHTVIGNETDAQIDIIEVSYGYYKFKLHNYNLYLTAGGSADGSNVYWSSGANSNYQLWTLD